MDDTELKLAHLDGTWTLLSDGEALFASPDRHLATDLARTLGEQLAATRGELVSVVEESGDGTDRMVARFGARPRARRAG